MQSCIKIVICLLIVCLGCAKPPEEKEIKHSKDIIEIVFEGIIVPSKEEKLLSPISGTISKILIDKGKKVNKNQRIAEFDGRQPEGLARLPENGTGAGSP